MVSNSIRVNSDLSPKERPTASAIFLSISDLITTKFVFVEFTIKTSSRSQENVSNMKKA